MTNRRSNRRNRRTEAQGVEIVAIVLLAAPLIGVAVAVACWFIF